MSYTVVGLFRDHGTAENAKNDLQNAGFNTERVDYSTYRSEGEYGEYDYEYREDERTTGFWDNLFGTDTDDYDEDVRNRYSRLGSRSNVITVHADDLDEAENAQRIMDTAGSIDVNDYDRRLTNYRNRFADTEDYDQSFEEFIQTDNSSMEDPDYVPHRSRIVNRRLNDDYRLRDERTYQKRNRTDSDLNDDYRGGIL